MLLVLFARSLPGFQLDQLPGKIAQANPLLLLAALAIFYLGFPLRGYRWIAINENDLFAASPLTLGSKVGILGPTGRVLKAADLPRPK